MAPKVNEKMSFYDWQNCKPLAAQVEFAHKSYDKNNPNANQYGNSAVEEKKKVETIFGNVSNVSSNGKIFDFSGGRPLTSQKEYVSYLGEAADSFIKGMDTVGADGKKDGVISRDEFINANWQQQKEYGQYTGQTYNEDEYRQKFGNIFDAINANGGSGLDKGEIVSYLGILDNKDRTDGKLNFTTYSSYNNRLATGDLKEHMHTSYVKNMEKMKPFLGE